MRIGALSKRTGISPSRIRFYKKREVIPSAIRARMVIDSIRTRR
jgi:DNA-binding transcriptional MerR regulator